MRTADYVRLVSLAAIWGGSFLFMRVISPQLGPLATAALRVLLGGLSLLVWFRVIGFDPEWRKHARHYVVVGIGNSSVPFSLYAFAALHVPAGYSAILNSTAPLFGAMFAALWLGEPLTPRRIAGLVLGVGGVTLVAWRGAGDFTPLVLISALACVMAAMCYGLTGIYLRKFTRGVPPLGIAGCSQIFAALPLLPGFAFVPAGFDPSPALIASVLGLGLLCSGVAYPIYFRLMADLGPTRTLTVTFLIPVFGVAWGWLLLREPVTPLMLAGGGLIVSGTLLTVAPSLRAAPSARAN